LRLEKETAKSARPGYSGDSAFAWMARVGYVARGVVFILIAGFAGLAALGSGDPKGRGARSRPFWFSRRENYCCG
jgi:hypothetical protein